MSSNHLMSTLVSSIKNAGAVGLPKVQVPYSGLLMDVAQVMLAEGFIAGAQVSEKTKGIKVLEVQLKYVMGRHAIQNLKVVSTPGRRVYSTIADLRPYYDGLGFSIISTSKGVMTDATASELGVGGEVLCQIF